MGGSGYEFTKKATQDAAQRLLDYFTQKMKSSNSQTVVCGTISDDYKSIKTDDGRTLKCIVEGYPHNKHLCGVMMNADTVLITQGTRHVPTTDGGGAALMLVMDSMSNVFVQKNTGNSPFAIDPSTLLFPTTPTFASFSPDGRDIALAVAVFHNSPPFSTVTATMTIYWCIYQDFTLNTNTSKVESLHVITGNRVLAYTELPLAPDPGPPSAPDDSPYSAIALSGPIVTHTSTALGSPHFAFTKTPDGNRILDYAASITDTLIDKQQWKIQYFQFACPVVSGPCGDNGQHILFAQQSVVRSIRFALTNLLTAGGTLTSFIDRETVSTWHWQFGNPSGGFTSAVTTGNPNPILPEGTFLSPSLKRVELLEDLGTTVQYKSDSTNYTTALDSGHGTTSPVVFTDMEFIVFSSSPFFDNTYVNAKDSEVFYNYYKENGTGKISKYTKDSATNTITKGKTAKLTIDQLLYTPLDWIVK